MADFDASRSEDDIVKRLRLWQHGKYTIDPPHADKAIFYEGDCGEAADEIERLRAQFPAEMQNCTIVFKECEKGHGTLTATNWVQHECQQCEIERLRAELATEKRNVLEAKQDVRDLLQIKDDNTRLCAERIALEYQRVDYANRAGDLMAERDALLKDAERYRWLQDHQQAMGWFAAYAERASDKSKWKTEMNRQIDAALSREKPNADQL